MKQEIQKAINRADIGELMEIQELVEQRITEEQDALRGKAVEQVENILKGTGLTIQEVYKLDRVARKAEKAERKAAKASGQVTKYANPDDPNQTWSGKGRRPSWLEGKKLEDFAVQAAAA